MDSAEMKKNMRVKFSSAAGARHTIISTEGISMRGNIIKVVIYLIAEQGRSKTKESAPPKARHMPT
jgi:hypothetical protein